jgi:hypothetical protein
MALTTGYNISNVFLEIDGKPGGSLSSFTPPTYEVEEIKQALGPGGETKIMTGNPKIGRGTATFPISEAGALFDWVASALRKNSVEANLAVILADQNYQVKRRVDYAGCMITSVEFTALDVRDGKKPLEVTFTFESEIMKFAKGSGKVQPTLAKKAKIWLASNFEATIPGIDAKFVTGIELPKFTAKIAEENVGMHRLPTRHYASWEVEGLKVGFSSQGFDAAQELAVKVIQDGVLTDEEFTDIRVNIRDQTMTTVLGTFTAKFCAPRKFTWSVDAKGADTMAGPSIDFVVEELAFERKEMK